MRGQADGLALRFQLGGMVLGAGVLLAAAWPRSASGTPACPAYVHQALSELSRLAGQLNPQGPDQILLLVDDAVAPELDCPLIGATLRASDWDYVWGPHRSKPDLHRRAQIFSALAAARAACRADQRLAASRACERLALALDKRLPAGQVRETIAQLASLGFTHAELIVIGRAPGPRAQGASGLAFGGRRWRLDGLGSPLRIVVAEGDPWRLIYELLGSLDGSQGLLLEPASEAGHTPRLAVDGPGAPASRPEPPRPARGASPAGAAPDPPASGAAAPPDEPVHVPVLPPHADQRARLTVAQRCPAQASTAAALDGGVPVWCGASHVEGIRSPSVAAQVGNYRARRELEDLLGELSTALLASYRPPASPAPMPGPRQPTIEGRLAAQAEPITWQDPAGVTHACAVLPLAAYLAYVARAEELSVALRRHVVAEAAALHPQLLGE